MDIALVLLFACNHERLPARDNNYYRVKVNNLNGKVEYSETRPVKFNSKGSITIFPNPAFAQINILLPDEWQSKPLMIQVFNLLSQEVINKSLNRASLVETVNVSRLAPGIYNIRLSNGIENKTRKIQVVK